jgi:hypothetical protein
MEAKVEVTAVEVTGEDAMVLGEVDRFGEVDRLENALGRLPNLELSKSESVQTISVRSADE